MMSELKFYRVVDREPEDWTKSSNGGDYEEGRTIAVKNDKPIAIRFWSSWDGGFCHRCGTYQPFECNCDFSPKPVDYEDWKTGTMLDGWDAELATFRFENDGFVKIEN